jgi:hypothetical protein
VGEALKKDQKRIKNNDFDHDAIYDHDTIFKSPFEIQAAQFSELHDAILRAFPYPVHVKKTGAILNQ